MQEITLETSEDEYTFFSPDEKVDENREAAKSLAEAASEKEAQQEEMGVLKETLADEIVRRKKLNQELEGEDEIKEEREYLEDLSATHLIREWERAPEVDTSTSTTNGEPEDEGEDKYAEAGL